jgi:hypothetical protein
MSYNELNPAFMAGINRLQVTLTEETEFLRKTLASCLRYLDGKAHGCSISQKGKTRYNCHLFCNGIATVNGKPLADLPRWELMVLADELPRILGMARWDLEREIDRTRKSVTKTDELLKVLSGA